MEPGLTRPGGKIEGGEDPRVCLARELHEEFRITAEVGEFLVSHVHRYPHVENAFMCLAPRGPWEDACGAPSSRV